MTNSCCRFIKKKVTNFDLHHAVGPIAQLLRTPVSPGCPRGCRQIKAAATRCTKLASAWGAREKHQARCCCSCPVPALLGAPSPHLLSKPSHSLTQSPSGHMTAGPAPGLSRASAQDAWLPAASTRATHTSPQPQPPCCSSLLQSLLCGDHTLTGMGNLSLLTSILLPCSDLLGPVPATDHSCITFSSSSRTMKSKSRETEAWFLQSMCEPYNSPALGCLSCLNPAHSQKPPLPLCHSSTLP